MPSPNGKAPYAAGLLVIPALLASLFVLIVGGQVAQSSAAACDTTSLIGPEDAAAGLDRAQLAIAGQLVTTVQAFPATADKPHAAVVALATAMQESRLRNLDQGDRDSLGVFQQRP